jgi:Uma2 family endonuclease
MTPTASVPATYRVTFDDWLRYPDDGKLYEVIEGELFVSPPPAIRHQRIARNLLRHIDPFLETRSIGEIFFAPVVSASLRTTSWSPIWCWSWAAGGRAARIRH